MSTKQRLVAALCMDPWHGHVERCPSCVRAHMTSRQEISTLEWLEAKLPLAWWFRYVLASDETQRRTELHFTLKFRS